MYSNFIWFNFCCLNWCFVKIECSWGKTANPGQPVVSLRPLCAVRLYVLVYPIFVTWPTHSQLFHWQFYHVILNKFLSNIQWIFIVCGCKKCFWVPLETWVVFYFLLQSYRAVLLIPDIYRRRHVRDLMELLLHRLGFEAAFVVQVNVVCFFSHRVSTIKMPA